MQEINNFLNGELVRRAHQWRQLKSTLDKVLPQEFLSRISYATLLDGKLTVFSDAPEWTSRMRFHSDEIKEVFAQEGQSVAEVLVRTVPKPEIRPPVASE